MDRYGKDGGSVDGVFYLSGTVVVSGELRVEPHNGGNLHFIPQPPIARKDSPFGSWLREFRIADADAHKFAVPQRMLSGPCFSSKATAKFRDFTVSAGETDYDGAYPEQVSALRVGPYKACVRR